MHFTQAFTHLILIPSCLIKYYKLYFTDEEIGDTNNLLQKTANEWQSQDSNPGSPAS